MPRVFLSYSRADEQYATGLRTRLEAEAPDLSLWQDRTGMQGGIGWWQQVKDALDHVEFMVLVMSPATLHSETVRKEWHYARQQGVCVYPVHAAEFDFNQLPLWMSSVHFFDLEHEWPTFVQYLRSPPDRHRVPFMAPDLPANLVERPAEFETLRNHLLEPGGENSIAITTALHGAGGFGKTTLAAALCHDEGIIRAFFDGILWVTLGRNANTLAALTLLHNSIAGSRTAFPDIQSASLALAEQLEDRTCLIVLDDVWEPSALQPFLRGGPKCTRLLTTRAFRIAADFIHVQVDEMRGNEAAHLLSQGLPETELQPFREIARRLGEWPLLLELANATLRHRMARGDTVEGALQFLVRAMDRRGIARFDPLNEDKIAQAMEMSLESFPQVRQRYFELSVFPENTSVPLTAVQALFGIDDFEAEELVQSLSDLSLLQFDLNTGTFRLHDAIRTWLRQQVALVSSLHAKLVAGWGNPQRLPDPYAWRWIGYHMVHAGQEATLRSLLVDFDWIQSKLNATDVNALIFDCDHLNRDSEIANLQDAIRLSAHVLSQDKTQLAGQLMGRLAEGSMSSQFLEKAAKCHGSPWLRPLRRSLIAPGGPLVRTLMVGPAGAAGVDLSANGRTAVCSHEDGSIRVWDLESGALLRSSKPLDSVAWVIRLVRDGRVLAAVDQKIVLWDLDSDSEVISLTGHAGAVTSLVVTADGQRAISTSRDGTIRLWSLASGEELSHIVAHKDRVSSVCLLPGAKALSGSRDEKLRLWDLDSGTLLKSFLARGPVSAAAASGDGRWAIAGLTDGALKLWEVESGAEVCTMAGHTDRIAAVAITPDCRRAISASNDFTLRVWEIPSGREMCCLTGHNDRVTSLAISSDGLKAISVSSDRTLKIWALERSSGTRAHTGHTDGITGFATNQTKGRLLSASRDGSIRSWQLDSWTEQRCLRAHALDVTAIALAADGRRVLSASQDRTVKLWDLDSGELLRSFAGHGGEVAALAITPDGCRALTASDDRTVVLWDLDSGVEIRRFLPHTRSVTAMVASVGRVFSGAWDSGSYDGTLKVWNLETGAEVISFAGLTDSVTSVAVTPDFTRGIAGCWDGTAKIWDLACAEPVLSYTGHKDWITAVALTVDGKHAVSTSHDRTLHIWEAATGRIVARFTGDAPLTACAVPGDGSVLVAGDASGVVHFLRLESLTARPLG